MIDEQGIRYRWEAVGRNLDERGRPLMDHVTIVETIGATTTRTGLKVEAALDERVYAKGIKVGKTEMQCIAIERDDFHPEWNYTIKPRHPET